MRKIINPFGNDSTPNPNAQLNESTPLPERGTGIEAGNAGERREGNPRIEEERIERHKDTYHTITKNGVKMRELDGYIPNPPKPESIKEQWKEYHKKHGR